MLNSDMSTSESDVHKRRCRVGLALSGGGARGFAHAGALKAMEEAGIKPDVIAGVSAGSVVAVMYAAGMKPDVILDSFMKSSFGDFTRLNLGQGSIFNINKFKDFVNEKVRPYSRLEELPLDTYIGVTDFENGEPVAFHKGLIGECMLASCSIPIVFKPVVIDGVSYVDGGVLHNMPSWIIRDKCDFLIGVNVSPFKRSRQNHSILDIAMHTFNLMSKINLAADLDLCDMCVEMVEISYYKVFNLKEINKVFNAGYLNMRKMLRQAGLWKSANLNKSLWQCVNGSALGQENSIDIPI